MASKYLKPEFMIIGERKCGTSSLYRYLIAHPQILPCKIKEPQFFSRPWLYRKLMWRRYLALFPKRNDASPVEVQWYSLHIDGTIEDKTLTIERTPGVQEITGEASANTFAQVPPRRVYRRLPDLRLILVLRNPVERAFSHYRMLRRFHDEGRRIPFKPTDFTTDAAHEIENMHNSSGRSYFVAPGMYEPTLRLWLQTYPREQMMIIRTSQLSTYVDCNAIIQQVYAFLDVGKQPLHKEAYIRSNVAEHREVPSDARALLADFYRPYNKALEELLGRQMGWDD
jgi:hypothetical protein